MWFPHAIPYYVVRIAEMRPALIVLAGCNCDQRFGMEEAAALGSLTFNNGSAASMIVVPGLADENECHKLALKINTPKVL